MNHDTNLLQITRTFLGRNYTKKNKEFMNEIETEQEKERARSRDRFAKKMSNKNSRVEC